MKVGVSHGWGWKVGRTGITLTYCLKYIKKNNLKYNCMSVHLLKIVRKKEELKYIEPHEKNPEYVIWALYTYIFAVHESLNW